MNKFHCNHMVSKGNRISVECCCICENATICLEGKRTKKKFTYEFEYNECDPDITEQVLDRIFRERLPYAKAKRIDKYCSCKNPYDVGGFGKWCNYCTKPIKGET